MNLDMKFGFYEIVYKVTSQEPGQVISYINNPDGSWQYEVDFQQTGVCRLWEGQLTTTKPGYDMAIISGDEV
jgi:VCBS repeat-containing protein